jgi:hypothetical protein
LITCVTPSTSIPLAATSVAINSCILWHENGPLPYRVAAVLRSRVMPQYHILLLQGVLSTSCASALVRVKITPYIPGLKSTGVLMFVAMVAA